VTPLRLVPFVAVLLGAQALANLDNAIVNVATPAIGRTLHAGGAALQLTVVAYVLVTAMLHVPSARLGAAIGRRRIFCGGIVLFTVASFGCGIATNATALVLARAAQGAGAALFVAQVLASIAHGVPAETKPRAIAAYTATLSLSAVAGQLLGGALIALDPFGWSWRPTGGRVRPLGAAAQRDRRAAGAERGALRRSGDALGTHRPRVRADHVFFAAVRTRAISAKRPA
jgi:MFS family permease